MQRSQADLEFATEAVENMYTRVAVEWLDDEVNTDLTELQREFLQKASNYYSRSLEFQRTNIDPWKTGQVLYRIGRVESKLGASDEAEVAYRRGIEELMPWKNKDPNADEYLGQISIYLAQILNGSNRRVEALELLQECETTLTKAMKVHPTTSIATRLYHSQSYRSGVHLRLRDLSNWQKYGRLAVANFTALAAENADNADVYEEAGYAVWLFAAGCIKEADYKEAKSLLPQSRALAEAAHQLKPRSSRIRQLIINVHVYAGALAAVLGDIESARNSFTEAGTLYEQWGSRFYPWRLGVDVLPMLRRNHLVTEANEFLDEMLASVARREKLTGSISIITLKGWYFESSPCKCKLH